MGMFNITHGVIGRRLASMRGIEACHPKIVS